MGFGKDEAEQMKELASRVVHGNVARQDGGSQMTLDTLVVISIATTGKTYALSMSDGNTVLTVPLSSLLRFLQSERAKIV